MMKSKLTFSQLWNTYNLVSLWHMNLSTELEARPGGGGKLSMTVSDQRLQKYGNFFWTSKIGLGNFPYRKIRKLRQSLIQSTISCKSVFESITVWWLQSNCWLLRKAALEDDTSENLSKNAKFQNTRANIMRKQYRNESFKSSAYSKEKQLGKTLYGRKTTISLQCKIEDATELTLKQVILATPYSL